MDSLNTRTITEVQQALSAKGFTVGEIDGICGQRLAAAVDCFQYENKLSIIFIF